VTNAARFFPVLVVTGARQVGKTSLLRRAFPDHAYVSLEVPSVADLAEHDSAAFFARYPAPVLIDEVQYAPGILRALKTVVDADRHAMGRYILTGSQKFELMRGVSESLAGRCAVLELEGLSAAELAGGGVGTAAALDELMVRGGLPELWRQRELPSGLFYSSYLATYLERDVRQLVNVGSLRDFERFMRACAARSGQLLNRSDLARDVGVSHTTAGEWLSVLVASNQLRLLEPWFDNLGKRLTKSPKLYLCDTGLLCFLLGIAPGELAQSPYRGAVFETWVFAELRKLLARDDASRRVAFYRDQSQREVDFVVEGGGRFTLIEAKLTERPSRRDARHLDAVMRLLEARESYPPHSVQRVIVARPPVDHPLSPGGPAVVHAARLDQLVF
jgi:hypothetical protein